MELKKVGLENLNPQQPAAKAPIGQGTGPSFRDTLNQISGIGAPGVTGGIAPNALKPSAALEGVKFSNHAVERMQSRGISFTQDDLGRLNDAVGRAAAKGSKDSLILMNDSALIVSVKNKTVVTVMDKAALKENVFTNIDSTIVM